MDAEGVDLMDLQKVILDEVRCVRSELKGHIKDEEAKFDEVRRDINTLKTQAELTNQRSKIVNGVIATVVAALVAWFGNWFGARP